MLAERTLQICAADPQPLHYLTFSNSYGLNYLPKEMILIHLYFSASCKVLRSGRPDIVEPFVFGGDPWAFPFAHVGSLTRVTAPPWSGQSLQIFFTGFQFWHLNLRADTVFPSFLLVTRACGIAASTLTGYRLSKIKVSSPTSNILGIL